MAVCLRTSDPCHNLLNRPEQILRCVVKHRLMVTPAVEVVGYGELLRSERQSQRGFDGRITDSVVYRDVLQLIRQLKLGISSPPF